MTREELMKLPEKTVLYGGGSGASVENGEFSYWEDTSIDRDIYNVDAYKLMEVLNVETLDDLFKVIGERFCFKTLGHFLEENNISFSAFAF